MSGLGDPRFRFSINLFGAPALAAKEFTNYKQDLIVGVSLQVSAPLGQYDDSKLLNLGNNRWSLPVEAIVLNANDISFLRVATDGAVSKVEVDQRNQTAKIIPPQTLSVSTTQIEC